MEKQEERKAVPPYVAYKTMLNFFDRLNAVGIPSRIDRSVLGSTSGSVQGHLLTALKYLGLMDSEGLPTDRLSKLINAKGEDRKKVFKDIIVSSYPFLFSDNVELTRTTASHLLEIFEGTGASGDTAKKAISFFLAAAKENGIQLSPHIKRRALSSRNGGSRTRKTGSEKVIDNQLHRENKESSAIRKNTADTWQELLLDKFPKFDPAWPDEIKTKWFEGFKELMGEFKK